jgi:hypothetical protein
MRKERGRSAASTRPSRDWMGEMQPSCVSISRPIPARPGFSGATPITMPTFRHTLTDKRPAVSADILSSLRIIEVRLQPQGVAAAARKDPGSCSARFPDGAGCGRSRAGP